MITSSLKPTTHSANEVDSTNIQSTLKLELGETNIFSKIAEISSSASASLSKADKRKFAAYFTPKQLSNHLVKVADYRGGKLGDKGAGGGILSASAAARHILSNSDKPCFVSAHEIIPQIREFLKQSYRVVIHIRKRT